MIVLGHIGVTGGLKHAGQCTKQHTRPKSGHVLPITVNALNKFFGVLQFQGGVGWVLGLAVTA